METNHHGNQHQEAVEVSIPQSIGLCQHGIFRHQIFLLIMIIVFNVKLYHYGNCSPWKPKSTSC